MSPRSHRALPIALAALLAIATLAAYAGVRGHEFIGLDDNEYVTENPRVQAGLSAEGVAWAMTTGHAANWHPLTWLSHMLDVDLWGMRAGAHHVASLLLHVASALLLFHALRRATGATGRSAFVAAVFALHPLHVESVAWVAERKDVLSGLWWMLAMIAYVRWVERPGAGRYALLLLAFALGLMSKPMLVTLPFVLLLLDVWPMRRTEWRRIVVEKLPLFALAALSCLVTFLVQRARGAMTLGEGIPLGLRVENALVSYVAYLAKAVWPSRLGVFYPHPLEHYPLWQVAGSALVLLAITVVAIRERQARPYIAVGWFWYLGTLVPVIGLVQVGAQARADRYTYLSLVGIAIAAAWGAADLASRWPRGRATLGAIGLALAACWTFLTWKQVAWWRNDRTLFEREVQLVPGHWLARGILGNIRLHEGRLDEAIEEYRIALEIRPTYAQGHSNRGMALELKGRKDQALLEYREAVRCEPRLAEAQYNLARLLRDRGEALAAIEHFEAALRAHPDFAEAHASLGALLFGVGRADDAIPHLEKAIALKPGLVEAQKQLDAARAAPGRAPARP